MKEQIINFLETVQIDRYEACWNLYEYVSEFNSVKRIDNIAIIKLVEAAISLGYIARYSNECSERVEQLFNDTVDELAMYLERLLVSSLNFH